MNGKVGGSGTASSSLHGDLMASRAGRYSGAKARRLQREEDHRNGVKHDSMCFVCEDERNGK